MTKVSKHVFSNGLTLVHSMADDTRMAAVNTLYKVGSRDEHPEHTGFAHLFEHLMFGGSVNVKDFDTPVLEAGGMNNAWTSTDITNYYINIPRKNLERALWLESDRMLSLDFNQHSLDVQRHVVTEEFKQRCLNMPYGDLYHIIRAMAYKVHPYRWPTIGLDVSHIENATLGEVEDFFNRFYTPSNAIIAVTGNMEFEYVRDLVGKWYGDIPSRERRGGIVPVEPQQHEERRLVVERDVPSDMLFMAFHKPERNHPDFIPLDMVTDILSNGRSSRLIRHLTKDRRVFSDVDACVSGSIDPGLVQITGHPSPGVPILQAENCIWEELEKLRTEEIGEEELEKVKNRFESNHVMSNMNHLSLATNLCFYEMCGEAEDIDMEVERYRAVKAADIMRVARKYLIRENCSVLHYMSSKK